MTSGKSDLVEVSLEYRKDSASGQASAFFQGDYEDDRAGNGKEIWIWLPKSQIEVEKDSDGKTCTVTMPEWLAMDKGLI